MNDEWDFLNLNTPLDSILINGTCYKIGMQVKIKPNRRADIFDIALQGKIAVIAAIEQDVENRIYLALVIEDDPGKDLGLERQTGHRFFYAPDEVEALTNS